MAGEWLKFEKATLDKPEVLAIAAALDCDPDLVVGKLIRMWTWFDTHTEKGNASGVTPALLDSILRVTGFANEVQKVGWLNIHEYGIELPNFDRHCGETAKTRALTAKRVAAFKRGNGKGNARNVTDALPREEKRREEKKKEQKQKPCSSGDERERFETRFWPAYPRKQAKADAAKAFVKLAPDDAQLAAMLAALAVQKQSVQWRRDNGQFIPLAATWIRGERWSDKVEGDSAPESGFSMGMVL